MKKNAKWIIGAAIVLVVALIVFGVWYSRRDSKVTLGQYIGLTYEPIDTSVNETEIQAALNKVISDATTYKTDVTRKGTEVKKDDWLLLDYKGTLKETGVAFSGGTASEQRLQIGSGKFIPGFEDALIGKTVGEMCTIEVTFPKEYSVNAALAGKEAIFLVTIKEVQKAYPPELTDELIETHTKGAHKTIDSYKEYVKEFLTQQKEAAAREVIMQSVMSQVLANAHYDHISKKEVEAYYNNVMNYYKQIAMQFEVTLETYVKHYYNQSMDAFEAEVYRVAEAAIKEQLVLDAIIAKEGLTLSEEQYQEKVKEYMEQYEYTELDKFEAAYDKENLRQSMLYDIAINFLIEKAVPKK